MALLLTIDKSPIPNFDEPQKKPGNTSRVNPHFLIENQSITQTFPSGQIAEKAV